MRRAYIGEFEELVLLITGTLHGDAYGVAVKKEIFEQTKRQINISAVHAALRRLEEKGCLKSELGAAEAKRGGRKKRIYELTMKGRTTLDETRALREKLWQRLPEINY
ncbi:MAG: helix-turn-helix transcriptional regulator [Bacteroidota bacterium]